MNIFFSSDYHLGHNNILKYDKRPFKDINHHDEAIITNHNEIVKTDDEFYFLGDFSFNDKRTEEYLQRINGKKFFIRGNHDSHKTVKLYQKYGIYLDEQIKIVVQKQDIILNHFPARSWNRSHHGAWHLYGHHHGSIEREPWGKSMDVGILLNNYYPFTFEQIKTILDSREIKLMLGDHHESGR